MDIQSTSITNNIPAAVAAKFSVTENAAARIIELLQKEAPDAMLRISVNGGGCSGFQYEYNFVTEQNHDDHIFEKNATKVIIDDLSLQYVTGSALDYLETLGAAEFQIKNPLATATCGCGNSFAV